MDINEQIGINRSLEVEGRDTRNPNRTEVNQVNFD